MLQNCLGWMRRCLQSPARYFLPGAVLVLALWAALGAAIAWDANSEVGAAQRHAEALGDVLDAHTLRLVREADQLSAMVSWEVAQSSQAIELNRFVRSNRIHLDVFLQVAVLDADGILRASTVADFKPIDLSDREHFRVHLEGPPGRLFIGKPVIGRASGKPSIQLSRRIEDDKGRFLGVVVISMDPAYLTRLYNELRLGEHGVVAVVGANDFVIRARRSGVKDAVGMTVPPNSGLRQAMRHGPSGSYESTSTVDHTNRIVSYRSMRDYPLVVVVGFSKDEYLGAYRARRDFLLAVGGLLTLLILFASARQARLLQRITGSERDLDTTLHAISDAVIATGADGRIKRMNPMAAKLTGWPVASALSRDIGEVLRIADDSGAIRPVDPARQVLDSGEPCYLDEQRLAPLACGRSCSVTISAAPIRDDDAAVTGAVLVLRDVTSERASAHALQASEARYRNLIELLPYAVFVQRAGRICYANAMAVDMLAARSQQSLLGREVLDFVHPDSQAFVRGRIELTRRHRLPAPTAEQKWVRLDGTVLQCEVTAAPYDWDGEPSALVLLQDIGARKLAERQRDRFFELSVDLQCIAGIDGYFKRVNPAFQKILGWTYEEILARPYMEFVHPHDRAATRREIESHRTGVLTEHFENRYRCKDGSFRWLAWNAVREPDGLIYAAARDVTESRAARQQLVRAKAEAESASRAKSAFLATMSHEIRTPMNGVIGMIEVLGQSELSQDQWNIISTIRESATSLLRIIDDILDFSKIEAGRMEIEQAPVSLRALLHSLQGSLQPVAEKARVELSALVSPAVPDRVMSDGTRLRQLLNNLVGNAIKFSAGAGSTPGRVEIRVEPVSEAPLQVRFSVIDNGIGIAPETLKTLFMPFTQAEVSTTRRFGGTGLGLAICRRLVDLMGGEIAAESQPGAGSTFTVTLPFQPAAQEPALLEKGPDVVTVRDVAAGARGGNADAIANAVTPPDGGIATPCDRSSFRILVAEDDDINQKVILRQLGLLGYASEIVPDGEQALQLWRSGRFALILTDLHMPRMDGYALARAVRREEGDGPRTPILALTANALQGEMKRATEAGMDGYLTKPLHLKVLQHELARRLPDPVACAAPGSAPPGAATAPDQPALVLSVLTELIGDDRETIHGLLADYRTSLLSLTGELAEHRRNANARLIGATAHKLKSSSRSVGALTFGDLCALLENAGKAEKLDEIDQRLAQVQAEALRVRSSLDEVLAQ